MSTNDTTAAAEHQHSVRFAAGDPDAIRGVYRTYGRLVYAVAYRVLGDVSLAEDAVQQTFVQAWREAGANHPPPALGSWLASIARHVAIDVDRRERRRRNAEHVDVPDPALVSLSPSVEQIDELWKVRQALQDLPVQDRELIRLQHKGGLTEAEIAGELSIPLGTVKFRNVRAHRRLAGRLGRPYPAD
jgi:RNA polymerase sigma factor (sigma-70 family)